MNRVLLSGMVGVVIAFIAAWLLRGIEVHRRVSSGQSGETVRFEIDQHAGKDRIAQRVSESDNALSIREVLNADLDWQASMAYQRLESSIDHNQIALLWKSIILGFPNQMRFEDSLKDVDIIDLQDVATSPHPPISISSKFSPVESNGISTDVLVANASLVVQAVLENNQEEASLYLSHFNGLCRQQFLACAQLSRRSMRSEIIGFVLETYIGLIWACRQSEWAVTMILESQPEVPTEIQLRKVAAASWLRSNMFTSEIELRESDIYSIHNALLEISQGFEYTDAKRIDVHLSNLKNTLAASRRLKAVIDISCEEFGSFDPNRHAIDVDRGIPEQPMPLRTKVYDESGQAFNLSLSLNKHGPSIVVNADDDSYGNLVELGDYSPGQMYWVNGVY